MAINIFSGLLSGNKAFPGFTRESEFEYVRMCMCACASVCACMCLCRGVGGGPSRPSAEGPVVGL